MDANTTIQTKPFIVTVDGEVDPELSTFEPHTSPLTVVVDKIVRMRAAAKLQAEMAVYDVLHGTNYRRTRNKIYSDLRNQRFEEKIGLERIQKPA